MAKLLDGTRVYGSFTANTAVIAGTLNVAPTVIASFDKANAANLLAFNTGIGANNYLLAVIAGANTAVGAGANNYQIAIQNGANTAVGGGANAFTSATVAGANSYLISIIAGANTAVGGGANAFTSATVAGANTAVGTGANAFTSATVAGANTAVGAGANNYLLAVIAGANTAVGTGANNYQIAIQNGANTAVGGGANAFTSATIAGANTAVGGGANAFTSSTVAGANSYLISIIAGANTAVGAGANAFTSATIAGANTAVGGGANNYLLAVIAGANTAVGGGANAFTSATVAGANSYLISIIAGANTAVGGGANAFTSATVAGANTAVGAGANAFTSATVAGANTAVGTGANNYLLAVIAGANTAVGAGANNYQIAIQNGANTAVGAGANAFAAATIAGANTAVGAGANSVAIAAFDKANAAGGGSVAVSDVAPGSPTANSLWWNSILGKLFIYYNDGSSSQWVETTSRSLDQLASNISVNTITTYSNTGPLTLRTGNANSGFIKIEAVNNEILITKVPIFIVNSVTRIELSDEMADFNTSNNSYTQVHIRNASSGPNASGDLVIANDIGTDWENFIDLGINGSGYNDPRFNVAGGTDGYLYTSGGNLAIGTANTAVIKEIRFHTGGSQQQNEKLVIGQGITVGYDGRGDPGANNMNVVGHVRAQSFSGYGTGFANMNVVNTLGYQIWNVPTGVKRWKVTVCGGGGSGGGTHGVAGAIGNGGGSGGVSVMYFNYVDGVNTMAMNVGIGAGFVVVTTNANGTNGFASNINYNGTWAFGNGGLGGANSWFGGNVTAVGIGGAADGGVLNFRGANGQVGGIAAATNPLTGMGGATPLGLCTGGEMAIGATASGANGTNAARFGGGGGGGKNASSTTLRRGGTGANGVIIIEW